MPQVSALTSIATGTTNVLSGLLFERVGGRGAQVKVYAVNTTTGSFGDLTATFIAGSDVIAQDSVLSLDVAGVKVPDHHVCSGVALPGDQLVLNVTNSNATARVVHFIVDIENA